MICPLGRGQTAYATRSARPPQPAYPSFCACTISNEWHIFQAFPLWRLKYVDHLATSTVVPQLMPVLLLIHRVLALQILLLDEVNSKWSYAGTQAQTLFSKFNPDVIIITVNLQ